MLKHVILSRLIEVIVNAFEYNPDEGARTYLRYTLAYLQPHVENASTCSVESATCVSATVL